MFVQDKKEQAVVDHVIYITLLFRGTTTRRHVESINIFYRVSRQSYRMIITSAVDTMQNLALKDVAQPWSGKCHA